MIAAQASRSRALPHGIESIRRRGARTYRALGVEGITWRRLWRDTLEEAVADRDRMRGELDRTRKAKKAKRGERARKAKRAKVRKRRARPPKPKTELPNVAAVWSEKGWRWQAAVTVKDPRTKKGTRRMRGRLRETDQAAYEEAQALTRAALESCGEILLDVAPGLYSINALAVDLQIPAEELARELKTRKAKRIGRPGKITVVTEADFRPWWDGYVRRMIPVPCCTLGEGRNR